MADSLKEQITKAVRTAIAAIDTPTYNNKVDAVLRLQHEAHDFLGTKTTAKFIAVLITHGGDEQVGGFHPSVREALTLRLTLYVRHRPTAEGVSSDELLNSVSQDIYKALNVDRTLGGLTEGQIGRKGSEQSELAEDGSYAARDEYWVLTYAHNEDDESLP